MNNISIKQIKDMIKDAVSDGIKENDSYTAQTRTDFKKYYKLYHSALEELNVLKAQLKATNYMDNKLNLLQCKIDILDLPVRITNVLLYSGLYTIDDLIHTRGIDILKQPGLGKKALHQIIEAAENLGFKIDMFKGNPLAVK